MNNEAIFDKKALNQLKKITGSGGGMVLVDTLPEIGKEDTLYKTPDGKIWSCINTTETETKTICDLEVGKSFKLKDKILAGDIDNLLDKVDDGNCYFDIYDNKWFETVKAPKGNLLNYQERDTHSYVHYNVTNVPLTDLVTVELDGFTEIPLVDITELLVKTLATKNLSLVDLAFAFVGGSHTETTTITTSTWTEVGGGSSSSGIQFVNIVSLEDSGVVTLDKTNEEIMEALKSGLVAIKYSDTTNVSYGLINNFSYDDGKIHFGFDGDGIIPYAVLSYNYETGEWHYSPLN